MVVGPIIATIIVHIPLEADWERRAPTLSISYVHHGTNELSANRQFGVCMRYCARGIGACICESDSAEMWVHSKRDRGGNGSDRASLESTYASVVRPLK